MSDLPIRPATAVAAAAPTPELCPGNRIYTNRNLRMQSIAAIGFDMDHTLAIYDTHNFNRLSFLSTTRPRTAARASQATRRQTSG